MQSANQIWNMESFGYPFGTLFHYYYYYYVFYQDGIGNEKSADYLIVSLRFVFVCPRCRLQCWLCGCNDEYLM